MNTLKYIIYAFNKNVNKNNIEINNIPTYDNSISKSAIRRIDTECLYLKQKASKTIYILYSVCYNKFTDYFYKGAFENEKR